MMAFDAGAMTRPRPSPSRLKEVRRVQFPVLPITASSTMAAVSMAIPPTIVRRSPARAVTRADRFAVMRVPTAVGTNRSPTPNELTPCTNWMN